MMVAAAVDASTPMGMTSTQRKILCRTPSEDNNFFLNEADDSESVSTCDWHSSAPGTSSQAETEESPVIPHAFLGGKKRQLIRGSSREAVGFLCRMEDFELVELLGQGFFGKVYKVRQKGDENTPPMVMKVPIMQNHSCRLSAKKIVIKEDYMLRFLQNPNILQTKGICVQRTGSEWQLNLLVDLCDGGSLQQLILNRQKTFSWHHRCRIALDICNAMEYVHTAGFMHRDLTSMNILLKHVPGGTLKAVVADFGLSSRIPVYPEIFQQVGTQNWMAPEMLMEEFYDEKADVFSFGVILCQMIARIDADHDAGLYRTPIFGLDYVRFTAHCPSETPVNLLRIAFTCCIYNAEDRPSFEKLRKRVSRLLDDCIPVVSALSPSGVDDTRLGRSQSDAAIRSVRSSASATPGGHFVRNRYSKRIRKNNNMAIPEGVSIEVMGSPPSANWFETPANEQIKLLAASVANEDPNYEESETNPFSVHSRYRSIRKIKPKDTFNSRQAAGGNCSTSTANSTDLPDCAEKATDLNESFSNCCSINPRYTERSRAVSSPASFGFRYSAPEGVLSNIQLPDARSAYGTHHKVVLGLGVQRELQGKITMSFRDHDHKFTSRKFPSRRHTIMHGAHLLDPSHHKATTANRCHKSMSPVRISSIVPIDIPIDNVSQRTDSETENVSTSLQ